VSRVRVVSSEYLKSKSSEYLQDPKLQIIHEDKFDNYWSIKAYKGGKINTLTGSVRDVEVMHQRPPCLIKSRL